MPIKAIAIKTNDTKKWEFAVRNEGGGVVDLTSATVKLFMKLRGSSVNTIDNGTVTVTDATNGVCAFFPAGTETGTEGTYDVELKITDSNSKIQRNFEFVPVEIRKSL